MKNKVIFGPVFSRRFGTSLGIDLSPAFKQCNFDCLYCELAPAMTVDKQTNIVGVDDIIQELQKALKKHNNIDTITLTANGEPTLYPNLNELIDKINGIKKEISTLILTNSATLMNKNIFNTLLKLDEVKLSLDAVSDDVFKKIDRPHKDIDIDMLTCKVQEFANAYKNKLYIEILFVRELNDTDNEIKNINNFLKTIPNITRIDIGTIDRPPAYPVDGISYTKLLKIAHQFNSSLPIHIVSRMHAKLSISNYTKEEILNTLDKRPLTFEDIEILFDKESKNKLNKLIKSNKIFIKKVGNLEFLIPSSNLQRKRHKS